MSCNKAYLRVKKVCWGYSELDLAVARARKEAVSVYVDDSPVQAPKAYRRIFRLSVGSKALLDNNLISRKYVDEVVVRYHGHVVEVDT